MKKINEGYCAELFLAEDKKLLKLYKPGWSRKEVSLEYENTNGFPSPQMYGMTERDGRFGFWMEQMHGDTMLQRIQKDPFHALSYAKQMAKLHYRMHQTACPSMPTQQKVYTFRIRNTSLEEQTKEQLISHLQNLSSQEKTNICHGDFHPMNILVQELSYVVIDWAFSSIGDPRGDVAGTYMITKLLSTASAAHSAWERWLYNRFTPLFAETYLKEYLRLSGYSRKEILQWIPIRAATYLDLGLPESENKKLRFLAMQTHSISETQ